jgi:hypothetical protein
VIAGLGDRSGKDPCVWYSRRLNSSARRVQMSSWIWKDPIERSSLNLNHSVLTYRSRVHQCFEGCTDTEQFKFGLPGCSRSELEQHTVSRWMKVVRQQVFASKRRAVGFKQLP